MKYNFFGIKDERCIRLFEYNIKNSNEYFN